MTHREEYAEYKTSKHYLIPKAEFIRAVIVFVCGIIICGVKINNMCTSLAVAYVGAMGAGLFGFISAVAVVIGYTLFWEFEISAGFVASSVIVYTIAFVFQYTFIFEKTIFMPIMVSLVVGGTLTFGTVSTISGDDFVIVRIVTEIILSYLMTRLCHAVYFESYEKCENSMFYKAIFVSILTLSFFDVCIMSVFSCGNIFSNLLLLVLSFQFGSFVGGILVVTLGVMVSASLGTLSTLLYYSTYSIVCCFVKIKSKISCVLTFLIVTMLISVYFPEAKLDVMLIEVLVSGILFLLLPNDLFQKYVTSESNDVFAKKNKALYLKSYDLIHDLFYDIHLCFELTDKKEDLDLTNLVERAVENCCVLCDKQDVCWTNHYQELNDMLINIEHLVDSKGTIQVKDLRVSFCEYCEFSEKIVDEINQELRNGYMQSLILYENQEDRKLMCNLLDYVHKAISSLLKHQICLTEEHIAIQSKILYYLENINCQCDVNVTENQQGRICIELTGSNTKKIVNSQQRLDELANAVNFRLRMFNDRNRKDSIWLMEAEPYAVSVGIASKRKNGEKVCGDQSSHFKTDEGIFYVILSDGVGTGENAALQSDKLIRILERFIINGVSPEDSINIVSTIFHFNNTADFDCATLDLLSLNLYSGEVKLHKYGAASTYIHTSSQFEEISCNQIQKTNTDEIYCNVEMFEKVVHSGDVIVLLTDGVCVLDKGKIIKAITEESSMKNLARRILLESQQNKYLDDDMTVITIRLEDRV